MFHIKNGLYFERMGNNSVIVTMKVDGAENAQVMRQVTLSEDDWVTVVGIMAPAPIQTVGDEEKPQKKTKKG